MRYRAVLSSTPPLLAAADVSRQFLFLSCRELMQFRFRHALGETARCGGRAGVMLGDCEQAPLRFALGGHLRTAADRLRMDRHRRPSVASSGGASPSASTYPYRVLPWPVPSFSSSTRISFCPWPRMDWFSFNTCYLDRLVSRWCNWDGPLTLEGRVFLQDFQAWVVPATAAVVVSPPQQMPCSNLPDCGSLAYSVLLACYCPSSSRSINLRSCGPFTGSLFRSTN